ncbi:unnamed protein product [Echinostoma caproni]|uniref:CAP-Gly domain-containing protein n=1 Tax=Echinostoma caproni TaxID=27848 RepID=A0A3P8L7Y8_9TREM|nr:unnamed protein product [Echinostoma caproni]
MDSPKGKHDGTAYGIRYFQCPARCGLFCRLDNLKHMDASKSTHTHTRGSLVDRLRLSGIDETHGLTRQSQGTPRVLPNEDHISLRLSIVTLTEQYD